MLKLANIELRYDGPRGRGIGPLSFDVRRGDCLGLLGPSGCGKSTLLKLIAGLLPRPRTDYFGGTIQWNGNSGPTPAGRQISLMFQHTVLLPHMTVLENVLLPFLGDASSNSITIKNEAKRLLQEVGIAAESDLLPEALSGGMRTRVALARALVVHPNLLLLDEPFSGLDVAIRESAYQVIEKAQARDTTTVILVSHDIEEVWRLCGRIAVMNKDASKLHFIEDARQSSFRNFRDRVLNLMEHAKPT